MSIWPTFSRSVSPARVRSTQASPPAGRGPAAGVEEPAQEVRKTCSESSPALQRLTRRAPCGREAGNTTVRTGWAAISPARRMRTERRSRAFYPATLLLLLGAQAAVATSCAAPAEDAPADSTPAAA